MSGALALAMALDGAFGEPKALWSRLPHPAVLMGRAVGWLDAALNGGPRRRRKGVIAVVVLSAGALIIGAVLAALPGGGLIEVAVAAILLAQRSLVDHVRAVAHGLRAGIAEGRTAVAMIVGRDTAAMDAPAVARAAIESAAENFSDGVIAPAFWFLIGGLPGMLLYKVVNTADSTIGYRTPRYEAFGWAAARLDDGMNWVPARLSAVLIAAAFGRLRDWPVIARDARLHRSPNAGWPEAAMAKAMGVALAGPRSYDGTLRDYPWVNASGDHFPGPAEIDRACAVLWRVWGVALAGVVVLWVV